MYLEPHWVKARYTGAQPKNLLWKGPKMSMKYKQLDKMHFPELFGNTLSIITDHI